MSKIFVNREGGDTIFYTKVGGVATEIFRASNAGVISSVGGFSGRGVNPVGSIVPILLDSPITGGGYTIPSTGTVDSNGFQLCDGAAIPAGNTLTGNTPNLSDGRYLRGFTASGTTGGANTVTLASNQIPQLSSSFTSSSDGAHGATGVRGQAGGVGDPWSGGPQGWGGYAGVAAGGNTQNVFTADGVGPHTHSTTVTLGSASPTSVNNEPQYMNVRYLIRVK